MEPLELLVGSGVAFVAPLVVRLIKAAVEAYLEDKRNILFKIGSHNIKIELGKDPDVAINTIAEAIKNDKVLSR